MCLLEVREPDNQWTPIFLACKNNRLECVRFLADSGARMELFDHDGWTPLTYVWYDGYQDLIHFFEERGLAPIWTEAHHSISQDFNPTAFIDKMGPSRARGHEKILTPSQVRDCGQH